VLKINLIPTEIFLKIAAIPFWAHSDFNKQAPAKTTGGLFIYFLEIN